MIVEHYLEFLSLKGGCTGSYESTLVKMPHYWKLHATAQLSSDLKHLPAHKLLYPHKLSSNICAFALTLSSYILLHMCIGHEL